jgi:hypothetical protein
VPNFPRLRALALFGRRPPQRADRPASRRPKTSTIADISRWVFRQNASGLSSDPSYNIFRLDLRTMPQEPPSRVEHRLSAILAVDVAGYSWKESVGTYDGATCLRLGLNPGL